VRAARGTLGFLLSIAKWSLAFGCSLVGWVCLTAPSAPPLVTPLWPAFVILVGSALIGSVGFTVVDAATEATLQCYAAELVARKATSQHFAKHGGDLMLASGLREPPSRLPLDYGTQQPAVPPAV